MHQPVAVINYPNEHDYTRVTEFKHLTGQMHSKTSVVYEYPATAATPTIPSHGPKTSRYTSVRGAARCHAGCAFRRPPGDVQVLQHGPSGGAGVNAVRKAYRHLARSLLAAEPAA